MFARSIPNSKRLADNICRAGPPVPPDIVKLIWVLLWTRFECNVTRSIGKRLKRLESGGTLLDWQSALEVRRRLRIVFGSSGQGLRTRSSENTKHRLNARRAYVSARTTKCEGITSTKHFWLRQAGASPRGTSFSGGTPISRSPFQSGPKDSRIICEQISRCHIFLK